jgi:hypothetical protein
MQKHKEYYVKKVEDLFSKIKEILLTTQPSK